MSKLPEEDAMDSNLQQQKEREREKDRQTERGGQMGFYRDV